MARQDQSVNEGGKAYQAGRDLTVQQGLTSDQMAELMIAMGRQLTAFTLEANAKVDERLKEFREDVVREFSSSTESQKKAFNEPDFQFTLQEAQTSYARSGDPELRSELVRLLLERSARTAQDRISFLLTAAVKICGQLTAEDRSLLTVLFVIKTVVINARHIEGVYPRYRQFLRNHVARLPKTTTSFEYLESIGCINIERVADYYPLKENLARQYGEFFPKKTMHGPMVPGQHDAPVIEMPPSPDEIFLAFQQNVPELSQLMANWESLLFRHSMLTALGKVIAHSILTGEGNMDAGLEVFLG